MDKLEKDWNGMPGGFWKLETEPDTAATDSPFKTNECTKPKLFHTPTKNWKTKKTIGIYELTGNRI